MWKSMQGHDAAFEAAQAKTLAVVEIVFRSIFGSRQSMSASWLLAGVLRKKHRMDGGRL